MVLAAIRRMMSKNETSLGLGRAGEALFGADDSGAQTELSLI